MLIRMGSDERSHGDFTVGSVTDTIGDEDPYTYSGPRCARCEKEKASTQWSGIPM